MVWLRISSRPILACVAPLDPAPAGRSPAAAVRFAPDRVPGGCARESGSRRAWPTHGEAARHVLAASGGLVALVPIRVRFGLTPSTMVPRPCPRSYLVPWRSGCARAEGCRWRTSSAHAGADSARRPHVPPAAGDGRPWRARSAAFKNLVRTCSSAPLRGRTGGSSPACGLLRTTPDLSRRGPVARLSAALQARRGRLRLPLGTMPIARWVARRGGGARRWPSPSEAPALLERRAGGPRAPSAASRGAAHRAAQNPLPPVSGRDEGGPIAQVMPQRMSTVIGRRRQQLGSWPPGWRRRRCGS